MDDAAAFKDPMEKRLEFNLKNSFVAAGAACRPAVALTSTSRTMKVWLDNLETAITSNLKEMLSEMKLATEFIADASLDLVKLSARSMAFSVASRRALWLKPWMASPGLRSRMPNSHTGGPGGVKEDRQPERARPSLQPQESRNEVQPVQTLRIDARLQLFHGVWASAVRDSWVLKVVRVGYQLEFQERPRWNVFRKSIPPKIPQAEVIFSRICRCAQRIRGSGGSSSLVQEMWVLLKAFSGTEVLRSLETGSGSQTVEPVHLLQMVQDGVLGLHNPRSSSKSVVIKPRLKRFLFPCPRARSRQEVSTVCGGAASCTVHVSTLWSVHFAQNLLQGTSDNCFNLKRGGDRSLPLLGRYTIYLVARTEAEAIRNRNRAICRLQQFGWVINWHKSCLSPTQNLVFLGAHLNMLDNLVCLPLDKIQKIMEQVQCLGHWSRVSVKMCMSVLGLMSSVIQMVKWARWHMRPLQNFLVRSGALSPLRLSQYLHLPEEVKHSLNWWLVPENLSQGLPLAEPEWLVITTDASESGWGIVLGNHTAQGQWDRCGVSSNVLELNTINQALLAFSQKISQKWVNVRSDNATAVAYIQRQGGTRSPSLMREMSPIRIWAEQNLSGLTASHVPGVQNLQADFLSRNTLDPNEWSLNPAVFQLIVQKFEVLK
ncbi:hypothetical protein XENTR_v10001123 [Xenopus tropicalis]|nr:hypothetical protein XENTR_v10001123 [Xenopus tropicalis]